MMEQIASRITLHSGDCLDILPTLAECSIDSCVTDPPYGLSFMGRNWDHGVPGIPFWKEVYRTLKPGGHVAAFGASRGYHRMACAIEDAGFEIRDSLMWVYGTGFPKSQNVAKFIDRELGVEGALGGPKTAEHARYTKGDTNSNRVAEGWKRPWMDDPNAVDAAGRQYLPGSPEAQTYNGFGTALKPAFEPIVLARKPLSESTVAANVLRWRTGALNIDGCRIPTDERPSGSGRPKLSTNAFGDYRGNDGNVTPATGRWPANVCHDGSDEVVAAFPPTAPAKAAARGELSDIRGDNFNRAGGKRVVDSNSVRGHTDNGGSAARFFYSAKASKADRAGSKHPTVKPVSLMQWLCRLITPPGGTILDPFAGSGTTGAACRLEGFSAVLIEREAEYQQDIRNRFAGLPEAAE